jgi:hypothetical protein
MVRQIKWQAIQAMLELQPMERWLCGRPMVRMENSASCQWEGSIGMLLVFGQPMRKRRNITSEIDQSENWRTMSRYGWLLKPWSANQEAGNGDQLDQPTRWLGMQTSLITQYGEWNIHQLDQSIRRLEMKTSLIRKLHIVEKSPAL